MAPVLLLTLVAAAAPPLPPSVVVYTNVTGAVARAGLESALTDAFPEVLWSVQRAPEDGTKADRTAWLLHVEDSEDQSDDQEDAPPGPQPLVFTLKTPQGQARAQAAVEDTPDGSWLTLAGVCGALACGPCPLCSGPGLGVAYALSALYLAGPGALGEALVGMCATSAGMCLFSWCLFIPPACLVWPLGASRALSPLRRHYRLRDGAAQVLPDLVARAQRGGALDDVPDVPDVPMPQEDGPAAEPDPVVPVPM